MITASQSEDTTSQASQSEGAVILAANQRCQNLSQAISDRQRSSQLITDTNNQQLINVHHCPNLLINGTPEIEPINQ